MDAEALIEDAMRNVRIAICERCRGWGHVGLVSLPATCPDCGGMGRTTTRERESCQTEA